MFRKAMLGDTATLNLDFSAGTLPTAVTFTRADSTARATFIDASGYVQTVASAGAARFDYTGGVAKGLLIEAAATNLLQRSVALDQSPWFTGGSCTRSTFTGGAGPDNVSNSGSKLSATSIDGSTAFYYNGVTVVNGTTYTYSLWAKADGANWLWVTFDYFGAKNGAFFDLSGDGALGNTTGTVVSGSNTITKYPNGWFRLTVSHTMSGSTLFYPSILPCTSNGTGLASITGQSPNGVLVYGAQIEASLKASSFIRTVASSLTRLADDAVISGTSWTSLFSKPGSLVVQYYRGEYGAGDRSVLAIDTAATKHMHLKHANASAISGVYDSAGLSVASKMTGNTTGLNKAAFNWSSANPSTIKYVINGGTAASGLSDIGATLGTWMNIGSASTTGVSGSGTWEGYLNNSIKSVKYYSELLSDADMIAKTT